jgi:DNA-binding CsgD family transcriptional regulator
MDALTKRQREVLSLAAKGMTNPEIGDRLGISKDGAKWHIGEILMRLDVDTREEAVDLWKRYNGLPYRLHRIARAVLGPMTMRWVLGGVARRRWQGWRWCWWCWPRRAGMNRGRM